MAQLDNGTKQILLAGTATEKKAGYQPHFISEINRNETSGKEIYFMWLSRLVILCAITSLAFFLCSTLVIFRLAPEIIVEPLLLVANQKDSESMVRYEPMTTKMPSLKQMTEMFIKQYIIMRNTVVNDDAEMVTRWGPGGIVHYMSSREVYSDFIGNHRDHIGQMYDKEYSSEVSIDSIARESENSPVWRVDFSVHNLSHGRNSTGALTLKTVRYRASVTPKYFPEKSVVVRRLINPLGFTVVKYNQSEIRE